jgi:hypothetical protein
MAVVLLLGAPLIFAEPSPATTNYLALVMHNVSLPTPTTDVLPNPTIRPTRTPAPPTTTPTVTRTPTNTPVIGVTITPTPGPAPTRTETPYCAAEYPYVCIPPPPPDLNCPDIPYRNFVVLPPDRHHFDTDNDGIGCEQN